jgi:hypothetical protein
MMQTGGGPPGEWSQLIVGHQWPGDMTIAGLNRESRADRRGASPGCLSMISPIVNVAIQVLMTAPRRSA